jgi:hypothetical protein
MTAAALLTAARSSRLRADLEILRERHREEEGEDVTSALARLEHAVGRELAERLVVALASDRR